jgi:hypothetical protein
MVDNRTKAGQVIAATFIDKSSPDGRTLLMGNLPNAIPAYVSAKPPLKDLADFAQVAERVIE